MYTLQEKWRLIEGYRRMRRTSRFFVVVFLIGISLLIVTAMRTNSSPHIMSFGNEEKGATSGWALYSGFIMFPRDFTVDIRANNTVKVYILDESAVRQWNANKTLKAAWTYEDIQQSSFNEHADYRGAYAILAYLPANATTAIKITLTFSGFEKDLLAASVSLIAIDILALNVILLINRRKNKKLASKLSKKE